MHWSNFKLLCWFSINKPKSIYWTGESNKNLGMEINKNGNCFNNLARRKSLTYTAGAKLVSIGLANEVVPPSLKSRLYTTFKNQFNLLNRKCELNEGQLSELKRVEVNILKKLLYISRSSKSTELELVKRSWNKSCNSWLDLDPTNTQMIYWVK